MLNIYTPDGLTDCDSYGVIADGLARGLSALGVASRRAPQPQSGPGIYLGYPCPPEGEGPHIAITMFESDRLPYWWPDALNQMDAVIVPSTWCADVFVQSGVRSPIYLAPPGINETFQPQERDGGRPFTFLCTGDGGMRKGAFETVAAFFRAFGNDMDYQLVIKARDRSAAKAIPLNANITAVFTDMTQEELYRLYLDCDCFVAPSYGEGFGLLPREFAATGGPAIATNWSGLADDIDIWGIPLNYTLRKATWERSRFHGEDVGMWAKPDVNHLVDLMRHVASHRDHYLRQAMRQAPLLHHLYSWRDFTAQVLGIWEEYGYQRTAESVLV